MNRKLKFRTWFPEGQKMQTTTQEWHGDVFIRLDGQIIICTDIGEWEQGWNSGFTKDSLGLIIMQFTGFLDNNFEEIYEGDLIKDGENISVIEWDSTNGRFLSLPGTNRGWRDCRIVGNRYENPELTPQI